MFACIPTGSGNRCVFVLGPTTCLRKYGWLGKLSKHVTLSLKVGIHGATSCRLCRMQLE